MTQIEFFAYVKLNPRSLNVWYDESGPPYTIRGVSIPVIDKTNEDSKTYLSQVEEVSIPLSGGSVDHITLTVQQRIFILSLGYSCYILLVNPLNVNQIGSRLDSNVKVLLSPATDVVTFADSSYNVLIGSVGDTRQSTYIMQSDRYKVGTLANPAYTGPLNIDALLKSSATKANIQDSSYSSLSWTRSRYDGTKTSVLDYKTEPALTGRTFLGAEFSSGSDFNQINYLLSSSQVTYVDFFYAGTADTPGFDNTGLSGYVFQQNYSKTDQIIYLKSAIPAKIPFRAPKIGDLLSTGTSGTEEVMRVYGVETIEIFPIQLVMFVQRGWSNSLAKDLTVSSSYYHIEPVQIYNIEKNKLSGVPTGLIVVKETGRTLGLDQLGYVVSSR